MTRTRRACTGTTWTTGATRRGDRDHGRRRGRLLLDRLHVDEDDYPDRLETPGMEESARPGGKPSRNQTDKHARTCLSAYPVPVDIVPHRAVPADGRWNRPAAHADGHDPTDGGMMVWINKDTGVVLSKDGHTLSWTSSPRTRNGNASRNAPVWPTRMGTYRTRNTSRRRSSSTTTGTPTANATRPTDTPAWCGSAGSSSRTWS